MAQYRLSAQMIGRSTGRSAVACAAYRHAESLADDRTGQFHDYGRKQGVVHSEIMAPDNAPKWMHERGQLWNAVEAAETRKNSQLSREIQLSLPHELTADDRRKLVTGFVKEAFVDHGMIADVAIHAPGREGDDRNHHAHVMLTTRELTGEGFGKKAREWNGTEQLEKWRELWAQHQNRALARSGSEERVDHRSYEAQGVDRQATSHMGAAANEMERRGQKTRIGDENRAANENNRQQANRHGILVALQIQIDQLDSRFAEQKEARLNALIDRQLTTKVDLQARHARQLAAERYRLEQLYRPSVATLRAEQRAIESRQKATGWRRALRIVTGSAARDADRLDRVKLNLDATADAIRRNLDIFRGRQTKQLDALAKSQEREKTRIEEETEGEKRAARADLMKRRKIAAQAYQKREAERQKAQPKRKPFITRSSEIAAEALKKPPVAPAPTGKEVYTLKGDTPFTRSSQQQGTPPELDSMKLPEYRATWGRRASDRATQVPPPANDLKADAPALRRRADDTPAPKPLTADIPAVRSEHVGHSGIDAKKAPVFARSTDAQTPADLEAKQKSIFDRSTGLQSPSEKEAKQATESRWTSGETSSLTAHDWRQARKASKEQRKEQKAERKQGRSRGLKLTPKIGGGGDET